jgi:signal transduction histidine kinase
MYGRLTSDTMAGEQPAGPTLSLSEYPDPACSFDTVDGTPVVETTNAAFETRFGTGAEGMPVADALERPGLELSHGSGHVPGRLAREEPLRVRVTVDDSSGGEGSGETQDRERPDSEYLVRTVIPDDGAGEGLLLFVETPDRGGSTRGKLGIDHVASVVSHDLRNPLDVARARLDAGRALDEDEHFDHVEQAHERMERIIQDVLTIARGEEVVEPDDTVDLTSVAETAWETVETNGATLEIDGSLPTATADPDRVTRLFENLFRNAVEHGSTAGRRSHSVSVTVGRLDDDDASGFYVADDGPGIAPEHRERVFEPGFSTDDHGTGLGLAIVARIADLHGWSIAVTTSASGGARFEVTGVE